MYEMRRLFSAFAAAVAITSSVHAADQMHSSFRTVMSDNEFQSVLRSARVPSEFSEWSRAMLSKHVRVESKEIFIGHWLPVNDQVAVSRLRGERKFFIFRTPGRWFNGSRPTKTIDTSAIETDLLLVTADSVIAAGVPDSKPGHAVLFTDDFIFVIDLVSLSGLSYNRGYH